MEYSTIRYNLRGDVAVITMNRPEVMNALNSQMRAEVTHAFGAAAKEARSVVLTGKGKAFCSGQDLGDRANAANLNLERTLRDEYLPMIRAITDCPVPTIAAVNGAAAGAGANLALAADVVIASESAIFLEAFTRIGLIPMSAAPTGCRARSALPRRWAHRCSRKRSRRKRRQTWV